MQPLNFICFKCKHANKFSKGCSAFPEGIPEALIASNEHNKPIEGQKNTITFEPILSGSELFDYYTSEFTDYRQTLFLAHLQIGDKLFEMLEECEKTGKKIAIKEDPKGVIDPPVHVFMK